MAGSGHPLLLSTATIEDRDRVLREWQQWIPAVTWSWKVDKFRQPFPFSLKGGFRDSGQSVNVDFYEFGIQINDSGVRSPEDAFCHLRLKTILTVKDVESHVVHRSSAYRFSAQFFEAFPPIPVPEDDLAAWFDTYGIPMFVVKEGLSWSFLWDQYLFDLEEGWKVNGEPTREPGTHLQQQIVRIETNIIHYAYRTGYTLGP